MAPSRAWRTARSSSRSLCRELRRRHDLHADLRSPRPEPRRRVTPRSLTVRISPLCTPGLSSSSTSPSSDGDRASSCRGRRRSSAPRGSQSRSSPSRLKTSWCFTLISRYRSPLAPPAGPDLARAGHLQAHAGVDARGDVDRHGATRPHAALALAGDARSGDHRAVAAAGAARARGDHVAEERTHGALDRDPSRGRCRTSRARCPAGSTTRGTCRRRTAVSTSMSRCDAEDDLLEPDLDADERVLAAFARASAARDWPGPLRRTSRRCRRTRRSPPPAPPKPRPAAEVVLLRAARVAEHVVGVRHRS